MLRFSLTHLLELSLQNDKEPQHAATQTKNHLTRFRFCESKSFRAKRESPSPKEKATMTPDHRLLKQSIDKLTRTSTELAKAVEAQSKATVAVMTAFMKVIEKK